MAPRNTGLADRLERSARDYLVFGPRCWPAANHFELVELDGYGSLTGDAEVICRACVREAAARMLDRIQSRFATTGCDATGTYLDLVGESATSDAPCSLCGECP